MRMEWNNETEAREQIKEMVAQYYHDYKEPKESKANFRPGDRISYASRVYDEKEMQSLTDAMLDFWLTTGRFSDQFEKEFSSWIGVKFAHLVNSGSSANLIAFMVLTAPELGDRQIRRGDEIITVAAGFPTTVTPAIQYGAITVFVDVTIPQYNIDVTKLDIVHGIDHKIFQYRTKSPRPRFKFDGALCDGFYCSVGYFEIDVIVPDKRFILFNECVFRFC